MTAPLHNPPRLSGLPASQNNAPVAEFRCLFTHDLRRKQKRWQDGFLKFHSFNSRVMVYDTNRNFQGDTYWKDSNAIQEGDELTLDKGIMVEVADAVGVSQTDLTPLFEKTKKPLQENGIPDARPTARPVSRPLAGSQLRHKSLNALLGTPKGPIGKALPVKSPFELRMEKEKEKENGSPSRAVKRQKTTHVAVPQPEAPRRETSSTTDPLPPPLHKPSRTRPSKTHDPIPPGAPVITLDETSSDMPPSSPISRPSLVPGLETDHRYAASKALPAEQISTRPPPVKPPTLPELDLDGRRPVQRTPRLPKRGIPLPRAAVETPKQPQSTSSPP
ncbi:hypothetical protein M011DRAFT_371337, partial [Sporormia fimetaria CBS 119925]